MSSMGEMVRAFKGEDTFSTLRNVKNEQLQGTIQELLSQELKSSSENDSSIAQFTKRYLAEQGQREKQAADEIGVLNKFYNGDVSKQLANIRSQRQIAYRGATDRAVQGINRSKSAGLLGGDTAGNSYSNRIALGLARDAEIAGNLDDVNQQKQDLGYLLGNQINLAGRRGQIGDSTLARLLYPNQLGNAELARRIGSISGINALDKSNMFYGLQKDQTTIDQASDFMNALGSTAMSVASVYGGGGGGAPAKQAGSTPNWGSGDGSTNWGDQGNGSGTSMGASGGGFNYGGQYTPFQYSPAVDYNPASGDSRFGGLA